MTGTLVNTGAVIAGSLVGIAVGRQLSAELKAIVMQALGLSVFLIGLQMALSGKRLLLTVGCMLLGAVAGHLLDIEGRLAQLGEWLKGRIYSDSATFVEGFVTASVLYCTGAMVIVGAIQDGSAGDPTTLYVKSLLDGTASIALASTLGIGVAFASLAVLAVQGTITLLATKLIFLREPAVLDAMTATGGLLILGIGINILELKKIPVGNLVPALLFAIAAAALL